MPELSRIKAVEPEVIEDAPPPDLDVALYAQNKVFLVQGRELMRIHAAGSALTSTPVRKLV
jgi:hypothetical protein